MKTNVSLSSIENYDRLKGDGLAERQRKIIEVMVPGVVYSRRQLSVLTGLDTSCTSGRVKELIDDKVIMVNGRIDCPITGISVQAVMLTPVQLELAA